MPKSFLLEIGTEEIPSSYLMPASEQLKSLTENILNGHGAGFEKSSAFITPRRISLYISKLEDKGTDKTETVLGPSVKVGKDSDGSFAHAAIGFAKRYGVKPENLIIKNTPKGDYFAYSVKLHGEKTEKILKENLPNIINSLNFPKSMKWEPSDFRFARPIRNLVALFGDKVIKFSLAGISSGNSTFALHTASSKRIKIANADKYLTVLRNNCIIADQNERKDSLRKAIESSAKHHKCDILMNESLLEEVNFLIEHPVAIVAGFEEKYLTLPKEILVNCLYKKQKCFPLLNLNGELVNKFIGVRNGMSQGNEVVREGYERVLRARLADADFFYKQDTKTTLESKAEKLKGVVFQEKLGSVYDKVMRIEKLALHINSLLENRSSLFSEIPLLEKACILAKADLVSDMVFEYPELQGVIGRIYALHDKEDNQIAKAIEEHYWPITSDGQIPKTKIGAVLAISDKIDTIAGNFALGLKPTGSQDPYGLRRMSLGILKIIRDKKMEISLISIINKSLSLMPGTVNTDEKVTAEVVEFLKQRLENMFESKGYKFDEIRAVTACGLDNIINVEKKISALSGIRKKPGFENLSSAFKRAANILKQAEKSNIKIPESVLEKCIVEKEEKELFDKVRSMETEIHTLAEKEDYAAVLEKMSEIKPFIDKFFEKIMVMVEDKELKSNRLSILNYTVRMFSNILDFSLLQG